MSMESEKNLVTFENTPIRRYFDETAETWYFSVIDVVAVLTESVNPRDYWFKMKIRVKSESEFELSTVCRQLKMKAPDGKPIVLMWKVCSELFNPFHHLKQNPLNNGLQRLVTNVFRI